MSRRLAPILLLAVVAACGDNGSVPDAPIHSDSTGSGGGSDGGHSNLHDVVIQNVGDLPEIYEYRDGSGAWQPVDAPDAMGNSTIHVTNDYEVTAICEGSGSAVDAGQVFALVSDGNNFIACVHPDNGSGTAPTTVAVTGTVKQAGNVQAGNSFTTASGSTSPWGFSLNLSAGMYDIAAFNAANTKMAIHRGVTVAAAPVVIATPIDIDGTGGSITKQALAITGAGSGATLAIDTTVFTANGFFDVGAGTGSSALIAPVGILQAGDFQDVAVTETTASTVQEADIENVGSGAFTVPAIAMLPELTGITFSPDPGSSRVHFAGLPSASGGTVFLSTSDALRGQLAVASIAYLSAKGLTDFAFDTGAAGYIGAWYIDTTAKHQTQFQVAKFTATESLSTSITDPSSSSLRAAAVRRQLQRYVMGASRKILP